MDSARKIRIDEIVNGDVTETEGYETNILRTKDGQETKMLRVLGTVVDKFVSDDGNYAIITLDDATETIRAKLFKNDVRKIEKINVGDIVDVFGSLRKYEEEVYIAPDIVRKLDDPNLEVLRNLEIEQERGGEKQEVDIEPLVMEKVKELDTGKGAEIKALINDLKEQGEDNVLETLRNLMMRGDMYEPKTGFVKIV